MFKKLLTSTRTSKKFVPVLENLKYLFLLKEVVFCWAFLAMDQFSLFEGGEGVRRSGFC
jgi:hypothetical protein